MRPSSSGRSTSTVFSTLCEGSALDAIGPVSHSVGRSALELYRGVRMIERGGGSATGESLLLRALGGEACAGVAEIGEARYDIRMVPLPGPGGDVNGVIGVATDVTQRVLDEARVLQADWLVAVGMLAAGVTREIEHPLGCVVRNLDLVFRLMRGHADEWRSAEVLSGSAVADALHELSTALTFAHKRSAEVRTIVGDLATFAGSAGERRCLLDVRAILGWTVNLVSNEIRMRARLVRDLRDVPLVRADEARLGHVFMNLLMNAAQAIPAGDAERHEIGVTTFTDQAGRAVCEVRDTGLGIPGELVNRIFEPFFTTRPGGLSPGLGLSICYGIVTALDGEISVRSAPGVGSVFRVAIPAAAVGSTPPSGRAPPVDAIEGGAVDFADLDALAATVAVRGA